MTQKALSRPELRLSFCMQLLVVPVTDNTASTESSSTYKTYEHTAALPAEKMLWYRRHYLPNPEDWANPEASPLFFPQEEFEKLPPAVVIVGELDVLRGEGEAYAQKLQNSGVKAEVHVMKGMPHPFLAMDGVLEAGKRAITLLSEGLTSAFA